MDECIHDPMVISLKNVIMESNKQSAGHTVQADEDVKFEIEKESTMGTHTPGGGNQTQSTIPGKEDTLGHSDFPPLSELEKQPKLQEEERIKEMNRKTSVGD